MDQTNAKIWEKMRMKRGDYIPLIGWGGTRDTLGEIFHELGFKVGAEVGVRRGFFSRVLCDANPGVKHYAIDPYTPYGRRVTQGVQDRYEGHARSALAPYDVTFIRKTSEDAARDFADNSLDYVYIDGLHDFEHVMMDLLLWTRKVRPGGIVSGHDYKHGYRQGVVMAVDAYTRGHGIPLWYLTNDDPPSFLWVNGTGWALD